MLGTLADLFGNANGQTPLVVLIAGVALLAAGWIGARVFRSLQRQGARIGRLERAVRSEQSRRRQVEQCLREQRIRLPYWDDDPPELYLAGTRDDDRDDVDDDRDVDEDQGAPGTTHLQTQYFVPPHPSIRRAHS